MLSIYENQLSGEIPESIGNLTQLVSLNAGYNFLEGSIPSSIGNLINLERLWLNNNQLSGYVPLSICNLTELNWAPYGFDGDASYLCFNQLCPPYPECIIDEIGQQDITGCEEINLGDTNYDGMYDVLDVVTLIDIILNSTYHEIADLNEDQIINVQDIVLLLNLILNN